MRTVSGIWEPSGRPSGGTSESSFGKGDSHSVADICIISFLVKDAQQDIAGERLKA